jgi:hypothetical protein
MSSNRDWSGQHRYGSVHKALRKRFAARMRAGEVFYCWRPSCPTPDVPISPRSWDLGHVDPELRHQFGMSAPEHPSCNRATLTHAKGVASKPVATPAHDCRAEFDPQRCPVCRRRDPTPTNSTDRWSRHWDVGRFNPRCPDCRGRGSACDVALEKAREDAEREAAYREAQPLESRRCVECGGEFVPSRVDRLVCSVDCRADRKARQKREQYQRQYEEQRRKAAA